jgi:hypothetical protein
LCLLVGAAAFGCASSHETRRPAATPQTEPYPESTYVAPQPVEVPVKPMPGENSTLPPGNPDNGPSGSQSSAAPVDQGRSADDLKITKQIRDAVMTNDALSFSAKNIDILTSDRKVVLRGTVKDAGERAAVERSARDIAGVRDVDNELVVAQ